MPLSFRRSFKKLPGTDLKKNKRRLEKTAAAKAVRPSEEFRPTKYPLVIPIGCGVAIGLCLFIAVSRGFVRLPLPPTATPVAFTGIATSAFETALAQQLGTLEALRPTETRPPIPTPTARATVTAAPTLPPAAGLPVNPWAADIPDAACIPSDLPQTGRVVEVVGVDTIKVLLDGDGHVYSVRYLGADGSQVNSGSTGFTLDAIQRHTDLVFRKQAVLVRDITESDASGTLLRYVLIDGVFINHALVAEGLARASSAAPDTACMSSLAAAEQQAQSGGLGLWGASGFATGTP